MHPVEFSPPGMPVVPAGARLKALARSVLRGPWGRLRDGSFEVPDWDSYRMNIRDPFMPLESSARERRLVGVALSALVRSGIFPHDRYDEARLAALRAAVRDRFEIPWTAISPRVMRLIYAINAIHQPATMVAAGVFCGYTFICNAGAAVGPGACYRPRALVGLEIDPVEGERAERNVRRIDDTGAAQVLAADAVAWCRQHASSIDLLYLDADEGGSRGKSIYQAITEAAWDKMPKGALLLAHNSINSATALRDYLAFVRSSDHCRASVNVALDWEGIEVSVK